MTYTNILYYPKVLLFGHSFNNTTGMGVTLTNMFFNWPKENIAVMAPNIDVDLCDEIRPCAHYIELKTTKTQIVKNNNFNTIKKNNKITRILKKQYHKIGYNEVSFKPFINEDKLNLAKTFNPDIIFCCLGSLNSMRSCEYFMKRMPNAKLVLYIVDDWVNTRINQRYFASYWKNKYDKMFRKLLDVSSGLLSICQYMSDEYMSKYGKKFYPFHNPVDVEKWVAIDFKPKYPPNVISIVYVGKVNHDTKGCLVDLSSVIEELNNEGQKYIFDVYTPDYEDNIFIFDNFKNCNIYQPIAHEEIAHTLKSYSALFLTLGFSNKSREYVRLSMPTKLSEYLASGLPILLYCPSEIALSKYLRNKNCSIICNEKNNSILKRKVRLLSDSTCYLDLVEKSLELAKDHDTTIIRECFRKTLCSFI